MYDIYIHDVVSFVFIARDNRNNSIRCRAHCYLDELDSIFGAAMNLIKNDLGENCQRNSTTGERKKLEKPVKITLNWT